VFGVDVHGPGVLGVVCSFQTHRIDTRDNNNKKETSMSVKYYTTMARTELRSVYFIIDLLAPDWDIHRAPGRWTDLCNEIRRWVYSSQMVHALDGGQVEQEKV
jgi:hypothetical protein